MEIAVLGPVEVRLDGAAVDLGTPKQRALVAALSLSHGRPVSVDAIIELLWEDSPPRGVTATLQAYVSGLRKVLEPHRERRAPAMVLVTVAPGYALRLPPAASDASRFEQVVTSEHRLLTMPLLGPSPLSASVLHRSVERLDAALGLWRGEPYAELEDAPSAVAERAHLEELRLVALEDRAVARLALGDHATTAAELEAMTKAHPLRERLWALRAVALVRSGRQADALDVLRQVREVLDEELGLDPGAELRDLQTRVLRQDPELAWVPPAPSPATGSPAEPASSDWPRHIHRGQSDEAGAEQGYDADGSVLTADAAWPMLGRDEELRLLEGALDGALEGRTAFAVVTGDAGIGKSRLCSELSALARSRGARVLVGRCSQDDGAPPLWPWRTVLERLGAPLPELDAEDAGVEFRSWELVTRTVRRAAADRPVVVVLDDLHWADTATLRVLRLLAETSEGDPLLVVTTWRDQPRPVGALADVAETLGRRHAVRVELTGVDERAVAGIVDAVTSRRPTDEVAGALRVRTDGNPFFLIEYARLAASRTELQRLLTEDHPPTAVQEVLGRRIERLPEQTVRVLRTAAVIGREFDLPTLAGAAAVDEDDLLDLVEPAQAAGLVSEDGIDRFFFSHALVRDTIYAGLTPTRRARQHAAVARTVAGVAGRETEEARHWLNAGVGYARQAWCSAQRAGTIARRAHAHPEAAELCCAALAAMDQDPDVTPRERYDVLMELVTAYRWAAMWNELTATVERAIRVAAEIGDPVLVAEAAIATTQGALWQSAAHGEVHHEIVGALRRSLDALPPEDSALRCRCMLSLANELYYATTYDERRALIDEALAMARRLGDPALLMDACQVAFVSLWCPGTAEERLRLSTEALGLARRTGNEQGVVVSLSLQAVVLGELGRPREMWRTVAEARGEAQRLRIAYGLLVLDSLVLPWHAMAGDFDECRRLFDELTRVVSQASLKHSDDAMAGAVITMNVWGGRAAETGGLLASMADGPPPLDATVVASLWRGGREDEARAYYADHPVQLEDNDWFSTLNWSNAAAAALYLEDRHLAARVYDRLAPLAGMSASAGSGNASGPIDGYLAMAAMAAGERQLATQHAEDAERLAEEWQIPLFTKWFREQRDRFGF
ncbi:MAG TPA: BTAD domain-containing putative transcriptional regulator [Marmoricola sp.]|nr:BTAD domain-containing putative transcriptional regulator [Marmoricola sp.]